MWMQGKVRSNVCGCRGKLEVMYVDAGEGCCVILIPSALTWDSKLYDHCQIVPAALYYMGIL